MAKILKHEQISSCPLFWLRHLPVCGLPQSREHKPQQGEVVAFVIGNCGWGVPSVSLFRELLKKKKNSFNPAKLIQKFIFVLLSLTPQKTISHNASFWLMKGLCIDWMFCYDILLQVLFLKCCFFDESHPCIFPDMINT